MKNFSSIFLALFLIVSIVQGQIHIEPPLADRLFPYVKIGTIWEGIPISKSDAIIPNCAFLISENESRQIILQSEKLIFSLGNWVDDPDYEVKHFMQKQFPKLIYTDLASIPDSIQNIIIIGNQNNLLSKFKVISQKPSIVLKEKYGKKYLFVTGHDVPQVLQAIQYLAIKIAFKANAYKTFLNFTLVRALIDKKNYEAAQYLLESVRGVAACGRNMVMAQPMIAQFSKDVKNIVKLRNSILYAKLPQMLTTHNYQKSVALWEDAMKTCYICHQGTKNILPLRQFKPLENIHSLHQKFVEKFNLKEGCNTCHHGDTRIRGYK